jgi:hypothetical protein
VHGIHGALWALELLARGGEDLSGDINIRFEGFLYLDTPVSASLHKQLGKTSVILESNGRRITSISLLPTKKTGWDFKGTVSSEPVPQAPVELDFDEASEVAGAFLVHGLLSTYTEAFPALCALIEPERVRAIANLSTLVGMRAPGLHSIFSKCRITLEDRVGAMDDELRFAVQRARGVLRQLTIGYASDGVSGTIDAFVRHPPVSQPSIDQLRNAAKGLDLSSQRALIVGGSRGLGELTAKLAALSGAKVTLTYASGKVDAEQLRNEIVGAGLFCEIRWVDVMALPEASLSPGEFTHIYYFATPSIFSRSIEAYDNQRFHNFAVFYCDAFAELCCRLRDSEPLKAFWPSTTAIDELPKGLAEYAMAKLAGELLCQELVRQDPGLEILTQRLPRLPTDQTSTVTPAKAEDPVSLMRAILAKLA